MFSKKGIDFSKGTVWKITLQQALPLTIAQLVQLTYNMVDRIFIGHIPGESGIALAGIGLAFPIVTLISAFTALFGYGGVPVFSIARGSGNKEDAEKCLGNSCGLLFITSIILAVLFFILKKPVLYAFGASDESFVYAKAYLNIYLLGTTFSMISTGLNGYINAQGQPVAGMVTILIGAVLNLILDPVFIFVLNMGVKGAALASVISQGISAVWVLVFLCQNSRDERLRLKNLIPCLSMTKRIFKLGLVNFIMQAGAFITQAACNSTLQTFGGDIYLAIFAVVNSVREVLMLPVNGVFQGSQPVISFNYGAKEYKRVISGIRFNTITAFLYTFVAWLSVIAFPGTWFKIFSNDLQTVELGCSAIKLYFFGFIFMAFQFSGQSTFQALGDAKHAIFFSVFRKIILVLPLTLVLPRIGLGVTGVFLAEPISNLIGGLASYTTMRLTVYKRLKTSDSLSSCK